MRMLRRLEIKRGWNPTEKHSPGVQNTLADDISRWPRLVLADKVRALTNSNVGSEHDTGSRGSGIFDLVLQTQNILSKHDDILLNVMMNSAEPDGLTRSSWTSVAQHTARTLHILSLIHI